MCFTIAVAVWSRVQYSAVVPDTLQLMNEAVEICCREGRNEADESYSSVSWVIRVGHWKAGAGRTCHGVMASINLYCS
jgi:hypothetical protein